MNPIYQTCGICGSKYRYGPSLYEGHVLGPGYANLGVCDICWDSNADGWAPHYEEKLERHVRAHGLELPPRLANGWLPRSYP